MGMKAEMARAIGESQRKLAAVRPGGGGGGRVRTGYQSRIEWVPCASIHVHEGAQRRFDAKLASKIAAEFDPDLLGFPLIVAMDARGGERFYVQDGQHRIAAVRLALGEDQQVQCEVVRGIDLARAAELFRGRQVRKNVTVIDNFLIGVTAKNPECLAINGIATDLGLKVANGSQESSISAVSSLQRIYRMEPEAHRGPLLTRVLTLAVTSWGRAPETFNGDALVGVAMVLVRHGDALESDALEKKLRGFTGGALGLIGKARGLRASVGGSVAQCVARSIVMAYNSGRTKHRLPAWGEKA
jgi:hypothetical protein